MADDDGRCARARLWKPRNFVADSRYPRYYQRRWRCERGEGKKKRRDTKTRANDDDGRRATDERRLQTDPCDWRENFVTYIPGGPPPRIHRPAGHPNGAAVASNRFPRARGGNRQGGVHTHVTRRVGTRTLSRSAATESRLDRSSTVAPTAKTPPRQVDNHRVSHSNLLRAHDAA